jgi:hypothetical protein
MPFWDYGNTPQQAGNPGGLQEYIAALMKLGLLGGQQLPQGYPAMTGGQDTSGFGAGLAGLAGSYAAQPSAAPPTPAYHPAMAASRPMPPVVSMPPISPMPASAPPSPPPVMPDVLGGNEVGIAPLLAGAGQPQGQNNYLSGIMQLLEALKSQQGGKDTYMPLPPGMGM